jgi:CRISPR/Cas system-associated exonuclease Cas4 (RecB family)
MPINMNARHRALIEKTIEWMRVVYKNYQAGHLPERPFTKSTSTCKYCPVRKECWAGEHGDLIIEKLDLPK